MIAYLAPFFMKGRLQYLFAWLPSWWIGKSISTGNPVIYILCTVSSIQKAYNQYWIVFFGEGSLQMATFNALENFTVTWTSGRELVCDKMVGSSIVKQWDDDKNTFVGNRARTDVAFSASEIVDSNCDIYDEKADTTIPAKTQ